MNTKLVRHVYPNRAYIKSHVCKWRGSRPFWVGSTNFGQMTFLGSYWEILPNEWHKIPHFFCLHHFMIIPSLVLEQGGVQGPTHSLNTTLFSRLPQRRITHTATNRAHRFRKTNWTPSWETWVVLSYTRDVICLVCIVGVVVGLHKLESDVLGSVASLHFIEFGTFWNSCFTVNGSLRNTPSWLNLVLTLRSFK